MTPRNFERMLKKGDLDRKLSDLEVDGSTTLAQQPVYDGLAATPGLTVATAAAALVAHAPGFIPVWNSLLTITAGTATNIVLDATLDGQGTLKLGDFPAGSVLLLGAMCDLTLTPLDPGAGDTGLTDGAALLASIGTATVGTDNATLTAAEANIIPSTSLTLATPWEATAVAFRAGSTAAALIRSTTDETTNLPIHINLAMADASIDAATTVTVSGTIRLIWGNPAAEA